MVNRVGGDAVVGARERILAAAYDLFSRRGLRDVGVDEVIGTAGVAKATFYRHFPSKDHLALAFLERRERDWTIALVKQGSEERGSNPLERLLAIFDVFHDWFNHKDFDGCSFVNVLLEMGPDHPAGRASIGYLDNIRSIVRERAQQAGLSQPDEFARSWHILMKGSIISAMEGDTQAAHRARSMARSLIDQYRQ
ncbi:TetR/AcrR family transcriptional regulator [Phytoactinopolyspora mesophila]|uniref:TetR family transcriptional regulator n=1 Tax=Phytoactinopolyspora mesophila TaxID=2650750 RepID=A0A7K3M4Y9_9ACTN|nr:TetR/AcrR family transcriptional regulator [Phytoactinopolyspora mesophila]NDL58379.1 TetR family transcriptional regulator [Phytoactinopolyspora mesophila]